MSFITNILEWIKDLFSKIPADIRKYASQALVITTEIKAALESGTMDAITAAIPGSWDDTLRAEALAMIQAFSDVLQRLGQITTTDTTLEAVGMTKDAVLQKLQSRLIALQDGDQLPAHAYDVYSQVVFSASKKAV